MNKTFAKLKRLSSRLSGVSDQTVEIPFEIECDCGATVRGARRASWIESECEECSATVFVLPMNVYPSTKFVPSEILGGTFKERLSVVTKEILHRKKQTDDLDEASSKQSGDVADASKAAAAAKAKWKLPKFTLPQINFRQLITRTFSPFRLLMLAVIATVGLTGWFMVQQRQTETAQKVWLESTATIAGKLEQDDLNGLLLELELALNAGAVLGKDDAEYRLLSNLQVETMGTDALAPSGLLDVFQAAYDAENHLKPDARSKIDKACTAGWFLFDAVATKINTEHGITWMVDFPATPGLHPVSIILPQLLLVEQLELDSDTRLLFVAKLSVQTAPATNEDGQWALQVSSEDFAVLTHAAQCKVVGFDPDEDKGLVETLQQQTEWVEAGMTKLQPPEEPEPTEE